MYLCPLVRDFIKIILCDCIYNAGNGKLLLFKLYFNDLPFLFPQFDEWILFSWDNCPVTIGFQFDRFEIYFFESGLVVDIPDPI